MSIFSASKDRRQDFGIPTVTEIRYPGHTSRLKVGRRGKWLQSELDMIQRVEVKVNLYAARYEAGLDLFTGLPLENKERDT